MSFEIYSEKTVKKLDFLVRIGYTLISEEKVKKGNKKMTKQEIQEAIAEKEQQAEESWNQYRKMSKEELLGQVNTLYRIHALSLRDSKNELIGAIVDARFGFSLRLLKKKLAKA